MYDMKKDQFDKDIANIGHSAKNGVWQCWWWVGCIRQPVRSRLVVSSSSFVFLNIIFNETFFLVHFFLGVGLGEQLY